MEIEKIKIISKNKDYYGAKAFYANGSFTKVRVTLDENNQHFKIGTTYPLDPVNSNFSSPNRLKEISPNKDFISNRDLEISDLTAMDIRDLGEASKNNNSKSLIGLNKSIYYSLKTFDKQLLNTKCGNEDYHLAISLFEKNMINKKYNIYRTFYGGFEKSTLDYLILAIYLEESMLEVEKEKNSYELIFKLYEHILLHEIRCVVSKIEGWNNVKFLSIPELIKHLAKPDFYMIKEKNIHFLEDLFVLYLISNEILGKDIGIIEFEKMKEFCFGKLGLTALTAAKLILSNKPFPELDMIEFAEFLQTEAGEEYTRIFRSNNPNL